MRLLKATIGSYIFMGDGGIGPDDETIWEKTPLVWQVPMVINPSMPVGQFVVGGALPDNGAARVRRHPVHPGSKQWSLNCGLRL
jgi:hypothetical protein